MRKFKFSERVKSFKYAFNGIRICLLREPNAWIHCCATILVISLALFFHITSVEWCLLLLCIGFVISAEIVNTAIEYIVNFISPEYHIKAGEIKDLAAGAVLIGACTSLLIGLVIFIPYLVTFFTQL